MKNVFLLTSFFLSLFLINKTSFAQNNLYSVVANANGLDVTITLSGPAVTLQNKRSVRAIISEKPIVAIPNLYNSLPGTYDFGEQALSPTGQNQWVGKVTKGKTLHYIRILEKDSNQRFNFLTNAITVTTGSPGEIFFKNPDAKDFEKVDTHKYKLTGFVDLSKHKPGDPIPASTIRVSGKIYSKSTNQQLLPIDPVSLNDKDGSYLFDINSNGILAENTNYGLDLYFISEATGANTVYKGTINTDKGYIIPKGGKEEENFVNKNSYRLLAPIPGMTMLLDPELCKEKDKNPGAICDINEFLNFILQLAIGLAAVVLVIRIIIDGYGYMLTDVPFVKAKLKGRFLEAMIGLVVALSSYLILNTVNPKLVSNTINIGVVEFEIEEDENTIVKEDRFVESTILRTSRACKGKIIDVKTGNGSFIDVCEEIAPKISQLFLDAKKDGIILSGGGYRTFEEQRALYNQNCAGGRKRCSPATARPGTSMHETGKAFDLKCDNKLITFSTPFKGMRNIETKKCFDWLSKNAQRYGLFNLKKENWHWSVNGK